MPNMYTIPRTKACQSCWTAKAKCEPDADYKKCKRCSRHDLECVLREAAPRKRRKRTPIDEDQGEEERVNGEDSERTNASANSTPAYSQLELEFGIHFYRSLLSQYFPFVMLSDTSQDSHKLTEEKPFLSLVIAMLGCTHDRLRQRALAVECRKYLAVHIFERGEKTLDLLQGLLLKIHWYQLQFELPKQRNVFMHLAMAMVVDLELNKSPLARSRLQSIVELGKTYEPSVSLTDHNLDEKRAFLGCLYLSSVISKSATHMDGIRFSEHAEQCCEYLESSQVSSDQDAVRMLRLQQIVERFETVRSSFSQAHEAKDTVRNIAFSEASQVNAMPFVDHWEAELTRYWARIPDSEKTDLMWVQYDYARICLYEISIEESWFVNAVDRLKVLRKCVAAVKRLHATFLPVTQQPAILLNIPSHLFAQSSHGVFVAIQLCSVRCDSWSYKLVEQELNLMHVFDESLRSVESMLASYLPNQLPEFFFRIAPIGTGMKKWYSAKLRTWEEGDSSRKETVERNAQEQDIGLDIDFLGQFLDLDDNLWLQNLLSPNDSQQPALAS